MNGQEAGRRGEAERQTLETTIRASVNLDGTGEARVRTTVPFLDHMLTAL
ncbi:MAG: imidazoleglycerol-phosphate dehydratase, partial [Chloroflexota bacterium]|nr:imidazoleglycerol-phosphate dehydratase [Chloroflexota bacterium]